MAAVRAILSTLSGFAHAGPGAAAPRARGSAPAPSVAARSEGAYAHAGAEPRLEELLSDPLIGLLMRADRVEAAEVRRLLGRRRQPTVI